MCLLDVEDEVIINTDADSDGYNYCKCKKHANANFCIVESREASSNPINSSNSMRFCIFGEKDYISMEG